MNYARQIDDSTYVVILLSATLTGYVTCCEMQYVTLYVHRCNIEPILVIYCLTINHYSSRLVLNYTVSYIALYLD
jgi:hypothetical protein